MGKKSKSNQPSITTSRRQFLSLAATTAVGAVATGHSANLIAKSTPDEDAANRNVESAPEGRVHYKLFSPGKIRNTTLKNRMIRSAAFEGGGTIEGECKQSMIDLHSAYAAGGMAMTMTGYMSVMKYGKKDTAIGAHDDEFLASLKKLADGVHAASEGVVFLAEIGHDGSAIVGTLGTPPNLISPTGKEWPSSITPSGIGWDGKALGHTLTEKEVDRFCQDMGTAAARLEKAGFDGIEIHGAHHYLINTFISPYTNRRTDKYGGPLENRIRIVDNSVNEIRKRTGSDFIVAIKLSCDDGSSDNGHPGEINIKSFNQLAKAIERTGIDTIDISGSQKPGDPMRTNLDTLNKQSFYLPFAESLEVDVPVILGCGNRNAELLEDIIQDGNVDFFNFARPLIREPDLASRWLQGHGPSAAECQNTNLCFRALYDGSGKVVRCVVKEQQQKVGQLLQNFEGLGV